MIEGERESVRGGGRWRKGVREGNVGRERHREGHSVR